MRARHGEAIAESVLDALIGRAVRVDGWEEAIDLSLERDDLVVVTPEGDRFAATGWRVRSSTSVVTAAAVEDAQHRAADAAAAADRARDQLARCRTSLAGARDALAVANRELDRHASARATVDADAERTTEDQRRLADELGTARQARLDAEQRLATVRTERERLLAALPELEAAAAAWRELVARRLALVARRQELEIRVAGRFERRRVLTERQAEVERRLLGHAEERATAASRRQRLEGEGRALGRLEAVVEAEGQRLDGIFDTLRGDYQDQVDAVRAGGRVWNSCARSVTRPSNGSMRFATAPGPSTSRPTRSRCVPRPCTSTSHASSGAQPSDLVDLPIPELPEGTSLAAHAAELERKLAALGPVNPLALEELSTLEERHKELEAQVDDVRGARRELHEVVRTLDHEIMTSFAAAAADVNEHFSTLVTLLFPGGTGRLVLTDPDDLLNTGVEIEVRPAGRNVRRVSLLSGGERSMAALAFLFAVFRSRPSPFYLMDEVEAALDDVNLHRFLGLVREFRDEAQLLIVSHQKRTMETGDALYGVTMAPGGSSQVVSQKVERQMENEVV